MKKIIYKYYWIFAGLLVGLISVALMYFNFNLILQDIVIVDGNVPQNAFSVIGSIEVILEYTMIVYVISLGQKLFKSK